MYSVFSLGPGELFDFSLCCISEKIIITLDKLRFLCSKSLSFIKSCYDILLY